MNTRDNLVPEHYKQILTLTTQHLQNILKDKQKTTKTTYTLIREHKEKNTQIAQETIWYDIIRRLNGNTLHWKKLWKHTYASYNIGKTPDTLFLVLHNRIQTRVKCKGRRLGYNVTCKICNTHDETTMHMVAECSHACDLWEAFKTIYTRLLPNSPYIPHEVALTANLQHLDFRDKKSKLLRTVSEIILHEIWSARCKYEHENIPPNINRSIQSVVTSLEKIIKTHYGHHSQQKTLHKFKNNFSIDNVICSIDHQSNLTIFLPP